MENPPMLIAPVIVPPASARNRPDRSSNVRTCAAVSAMGVAALPAGWAVEVEAVFQVEE